MNINEPFLSGSRDRVYDILSCPCHTQFSEMVHLQYFLTKTAQSSLLIIWLCRDGNMNGFTVTFIADSGSTYQPWSSALLAVFLMHAEPQPEWMLLADALISAPWLHEHR